MNREYYAMRLAVSAYGYDLSEYPPEIRAVELAEADAQASPEEQRETARTIQNAFRAQDYVCRIGGDEFAVIMTQLGANSGALIAEKVKKINDEVEQPKDGVPGVSISCGAAYGARYENFDRLFHEADAALYRVKRGGGGGCEICG